MRLKSMVAMLVLVIGLSACSSDESDATDAGDAPDATPTAADGECVYVEGGRAAKDVDLPPSDPVAAEELTIATNRGDITVTLDAEGAPCTVNSFVSLAEQDYFNDTLCHRLVPGFVLQCGDPSASGSGGPGYRFADELSGDETYPAGTFAMANAGPDTNGSQFFIVLADATLPPSYTVFGTVDAESLAVARAIEADGNAANGVAPAEDVLITSVS